MKTKIISFILALSAFMGVFPSVGYAGADDGYTKETYIKQDFENGKVGFNLQNSVVNKITNTASLEESGGNTYLLLKKNIKDGDCYADFYIGKTKRNIVIEFDMKVNSIGIDAMPLYIRDTSSSADGSAKNDWLLHLNQSGLLKSKNGSYQMTPFNWVHVVLYMNLDEKKYTVTVNNNIIDENSVYSPLDIYSPDLLRIYAGSGTGTLCVDNLYVYGGSVKRDIKNETPTGRRKSLAKTDAYSKMLLKDKTAINTKSKKIFSDGRKTASSAVYEENGEAYVTVSDLEKLLGSSVAESSDSFTIGDITAYKDSYTVGQNGASISCDYPVKSIDGVYMLPLMQTAKLLGKYATTDDRGLYVVSDSDITLSEADIKEISCYMFFERETADDLKSLLTKNPQKHPSVMMDADGFAGLSERIKTDSSLARWHNARINAATRLLDEPLPTYQKEGVRIMNVANSIQIRIMNLAYAYNMTKDERYAIRAWEITEAALAFPDWNADAHFLDTGILVFGIGVCYDWLYDWLGEERRERIYQKTKEFAFSKAYGAYYGTDEVMKNHFFVNGKTNWTGVCNGGIGVAAMAMIEEDEAYLLDLISAAQRSFEYVVYETGPDGAWHEGVGYWDFFLTYFARFMKSYDNVFGGKSNFKAFKGMESFGYFGSVMSSPEGNNNFHDSSLEHYVPHAMLYLADIYSDNALATEWLRQSTAHSVQADIDTICYYKPFAGKDTDIKTVYYRGIEAVSVKENPKDENGMFFSTHGGGAKESHDHYDAGTFVYDILGERWILDLGKTDYDLQDVLGKENMYRVRSEGHNTLTVNPSKAAGQNKNGYSKLERFEYNDSSAVGVLDLTLMYSDLKSAKRGFYVGDNRRAVTVRDEFEIKSPGTVYSFLHTDASITKVSDTEYTLKKDNKKVNIVISCDAPFESYIAEPICMDSSLQSSYQDANPGVKKIAVKMTASGKTALTVKISPDGEGIDKAPSDTSIADMKIEKTVNTFAEGNISGYGGRDIEDKSLFAEKLVVDSTLSRSEDGINAWMSFYAAFNENGFIDLIGKKNNSSKEEVIVRAVEEESGSLRIAGKTVTESGFKFMPDKWYKVDILVKTAGNNTISVWLDNKAMAQNVEFSDGETVEEITAVSMENAYIDDYIAKEADSVTIPSLTFTSTDNNYKKYMMSDYGYYAYCNETSDIGTLYLSKLGKKNIKDAVIKTADSPFCEKYLVMTDSEYKKLYMPVYDIGEGIYSGSEMQKTLAENPLLSGPVTFKMKLNAKNSTKINLMLDKTECNMLTFGTSKVTTVGGKSAAYKQNEPLTVHITVYPKRKTADIYINSQLVANIVTVSSAAFSSVTGYTVTGTDAVKTEVYSGGYKCGLRTEDEDNKLYVKSAFCRDVDIIAAGYEGNVLKEAKVHSVKTGRNAVTADGVSDGTDKKFMLWDSIDGMKPIE